MEGSLRVVGSASSSCVGLVTALLTPSLVWVSVPLLQPNLPWRRCSAAARPPACLPAALSLYGRREAAGSLSSRGRLECGQASEAERHDSSEGDACVCVCVVAKQQRAFCMEVKRKREHERGFYRHRR